MRETRDVKASGLQGDAFRDVIEVIQVIGSRVETSIASTAMKVATGSSIPVAPRTTNLQPFTTATITNDAGDPSQDFTISHAGPSTTGMQVFVTRPSS